MSQHSHPENQNAYLWPLVTKPAFLVSTGVAIFLPLLMAPLYSDEFNPVFFFCGLISLTTGGILGAASISGFHRAKRLRSGS